MKLKKFKDCNKQDCPIIPMVKQYKGTFKKQLRHYEVLSFTELQADFQVLANDPDNFIEVLSEESAKDQASSYIYEVENDWELYNTRQRYTMFS